MPAPKTTKGRWATRPRRSRATPEEPARPARRQAVLYARVSTKDQEREGYSIPAQKELLVAYAADKGFDVVHEFVDVETAKRAGRTAFSEMVTFLKKTRTCKVVLVEKTDRLYRNLKDWVRLDDMDLEIHLAKEGVVLSDGSRSTDKFMHGIRVLMAKNYIDNLSEEVRKGMRQKAQEGHWPNPAPIGYLNRREAGKSTLVRDPERAPLIAGVFERCAAGQSIDDIVAWVRQAGMKGKHGGVVTKSTIHSVLRNPLYAGQFWWDGVLYDGKDPTLISVTLFDRAQARLDGHHDTRVNTHEFAFSGLIRCAHCGLAVVAEIQKKKYIYYHCSRNCQKEPFVREEKLVDMFGSVLRALHLGDKGMELAREVLLDSRKSIKADAEARQQAARLRYDRLTHLIDKAYEDKLEGRVDEEFFQRRREEWDRERTALVETMQRLNKADRENLDLAVQVLEIGNRAYELYNEASVTEKRQLLDLLCSNCEMGNGRLMINLRDPWNKQRSLAEAMRNEETPLTEIKGVRSEWWAILDLNQ